MSTIGDIIKPHVGKPTVEIAKLTGLTYRQVYDALKYRDLQVVQMPEGMCRNGHVARKLVVKNGGETLNSLCVQCKRDREKRYREHLKRTRKWLYKFVKAKVDAKEATITP